MKRFGNLYGKICDMDNLIAAHNFAREDKLYYKEVKMVDSDPAKYLTAIQDMLINKTYLITCKDYIVSTLRDRGKERELWKLPYYPHRIIQWAIMLQIEKVFMQVFCNHTCASIKQRGTKQAYLLTRRFLQNDETGTQYCLKMDIKKFYPNVNHEKLKMLLRRKFKDTELLELLDMLIDSYPTEKGVPIGSYLSQFLANFYLAYFDHWLKEDMGVKYVVRYMDDIIILHGNKQYLHFLRAKIAEYLYNELFLFIKGNWQVFPVKKRGIDFVGFRFFPKYILLRKRICQCMKKKFEILWEKHYFFIPISYREWCSANSYLGWLKWCNSFRLFSKYVVPIKPALALYYGKHVAGSMPKKKWFKRMKKYIKSLRYKNYKVAA